jgi:hypothetical protein
VRAGKHRQIVSTGITRRRGRPARCLGFQIYLAKFSIGNSADLAFILFKIFLNFELHGGNIFHVSPLSATGGRLFHSCGNICGNLLGHYETGR